MSTRPSTKPNATTAPDDLRAEDARARRAAQTVFDRPLVIEAGAGTGKTATLVARVLAWSLGPGWRRAAERLADRPLDLERPGVDAERRLAGHVLRGIVAMTFTEAAASEMAERIARAFDQVAEGEVPVGVDLEIEGPIEARARLLADASHELQITTIHGFCFRLLAEHPFEAGLPPRFQVDESGEQVALRAERVIAESLPALYDEPGSPDALALAAEGIGPPELADALVALDRAGARAADLERDPVSDSARAGLVARLHAATTRLLAHLESTLAGGRGTPNAERLLSLLRRIDLASSGQEAGRSTLEALVAMVGQHQSVGLRRHLAGWGRGRFNRGERERFAGREDAIGQAARTLLPILDHVADLDLERLEAARGTLAPLYRTLTRQLRADGIVGFADLTILTASMLARHPWIAATVRGRIEQLLVDEFQDTDAHQCAIVARLALTGSPEGRPGLFIVGDPKQSIYGWRGADLRAYEAFVDSVTDSGGTRLPLVVNFRSTPPILDEVERLLAPIMTAEPGVQAPFVPLVASRRGSGHDPIEPGPPGRAPWRAVEHWISWPGDPRIRQRSADATRVEALAVAADVQALIAAGTDPGGIALLARTTTDLEPYLRALRDAGIDHAVGRDRHYYRRREIVDAAAAVRAILSPTDTVALVALIRSPAVGVPDAALLPLWRHGFAERVAALGEPETRAHVVEVDVAGVDVAGVDAVDPERALDACRRSIDRARREVPTGLPGIDRLADWPAALEHAVTVIGALRAIFDQAPTDRFLEMLRRFLVFDAAYGARYLGDYRLANLDRFFDDLALDLDAAAGDRHAVLRRLRRRARDRPDEPPQRRSGAGQRDPHSGDPRSGDSRPSESGPVQVMTIHAAKGLEFPHVYLIQTHKTSAGPRASDVEWAPGRPGTEYRLFGAASLGWDRRQHHARATERAEMVRTLYVATTRAESRLVIAGSRPLDPPSVSDSRSHADLLGHRRGDAPDLEALIGSLARSPASRRAEDGVDGNVVDGDVVDGDAVDGDGVVWRLSALASAPIPSARTTSTDGVEAGIDDLPAPMDLIADEARRRHTARERMDRPFRIGASSLGASLRDSDGDPGSGDPGRGDPAARERAMATGTLVHWVLETVDLGAHDPLRALAAGRSRLAASARAHGFEASGLAADSVAGAIADAEALLDRFRDGPLFERWLAIRDRVVARELAVLLPPDVRLEPGPDGIERPTGYIVGAVDLIYRRRSGDYAIVDYKTDRASADAPETAIDPKYIDPKYAAQGLAYSRALEQALTLDSPPRFELWYLASGRIVVLDDRTNLGDRKAFDASPGATDKVPEP